MDTGGGAITGFFLRAMRWQDGSARVANVSRVNLLSGNAANLVGRHDAICSGLGGGDTCSGFALDASSSQAGTSSPSAFTLLPAPAPATASGVPASATWALLAVTLALACLGVWNPPHRKRSDQN